MRPRTNKDGRFETGTLEIKNGFYTYVTPGAKGTDNFRLHQVSNSPFFVVMHQQRDKRGYFYALIEKKGDYYLADGAPERSFCPRLWLFSSREVKLPLG
jgi:hypothetical protein